MTEIVACYAVANEEDHIAESVRSVKAYVDRYVVVDSIFESNPDPATHSTDDTRRRIEVAAYPKPVNYIEADRKLTEVVARNTYLQAIELPDWAFIIDGDEILYGDYGKIVDLFERVRAGVQLGPVSLPVYTTAINVPKMGNEITSSEFATAPLISTVGRMPRLIPVIGRLRYVVERNASTPILAYKTAESYQYLEPSTLVDADTMFLINNHHRQSFESYLNDYEWETKGVLR